MEIDSKLTIRATQKRLEKLLCVALPVAATSALLSRHRPGRRVSSAQLPLECPSRASNHSLTDSLRSLQAFAVSVFGGDCSHAHASLIVTDQAARNGEAVRCCHRLLGAAAASSIRRRERRDHRRRLHRMDHGLQLRRLGCRSEHPTPRWR